MSTTIVVEAIGAVALVAVAVVTWFLSRKKTQSETEANFSSVIHENVDAIAAILAVYKQENAELREAVNELKRLNESLTEEVLELKELCEKTQKNIATKLWRN